MPTSLIYFENDAISRGNLLILGTFPRVIDTFLYDYVVWVGAWRICRRHSLPADNDRFVQMKTVCTGKVRAEKQKNAKYGVWRVFVLAVGLKWVLSRLNHRFWHQSKIVQQQANQKTDLITN